MTGQMLELFLGDCREAMAKMDECSVDAIVTDPPYGLEFMGKDWDNLKPTTGGAKFKEAWGGRTVLPLHTGTPNPVCRNCGGTKRGRDRKKFKRCRCDAPDFPNMRKKQGEDQQAWHYLWALEAFRVLKPGGHLLVMGGTRTYHRMACGVEDAGFEIRDSIDWIYGQGFPKSLDVGKAIGAATITAPATPEAAEWDGWGTALKPAHEPIVVARKPFDDTVADNVLKHGTGGLNVDGCRQETDDDLGGGSYGGCFSGSRDEDGDLCEAIGSGDKGRWPPNVLLTHHPDCEQIVAGSGEGHQAWRCVEGCPVPELDEQSDGSAHKFPCFHYRAKAARSEKENGCERIEGSTREGVTGRVADSPGLKNPRSGMTRQGKVTNSHPTVKPVGLMRWLVRLVTPPGGTVLDPFMGSGTTGVACHEEGFGFVGVELSPEYFEIAEARNARARQQLKMF